MGLAQSLLTSCTHLWDAGDTHVVLGSGAMPARHGPQGLRGTPHISGRARRGRKIMFYEKHKPFYAFTNFSPHEVVYGGKSYPTSEHLFQAFKFLQSHPDIAEHVRTCSPKPMVAFDEAHRHKSKVRNDWGKVHVNKMETALRLKFTQHQTLRKMLLDTGDAELVEDSPRDWFWGIGADGTGSNELGKALMRLREILRQEAQAGITYPPVLPLASIHASGGQAIHPMCEFCGSKPTYLNSKYCSRTCSEDAATLCKYCRTKPMAKGRGMYCSKACVDKARGR